MSENTILEINEIPTLTPTPIPITSIKKETYVAPTPAPVPTPAPTPIAVKEETYTKPAPKRRVRPSRLQETNKKDDVSKTPNDTVNNNIQTLKLDKYILENDDDIVPDKKVPLNYNLKRTLGLRFF